MASYKDLQEFANKYRFLQCSITQSFDTESTVEIQIGLNDLLRIIDDTQRNTIATQNKEAIPSCSCNPSDEYVSINFSDVVGF